MPEYDIERFDTLLSYVPEPTESVVDDLLVRTAHDPRVSPYTPFEGPPELLVLVDVDYES